MDNHTIERICRKCGNPYPLTSEYFVRDKKHSSGFMTQCKTCRNANKRAWDKENSDKKRAMRRRYSKKSSLIKEFYSGLFLFQSRECFLKYQECSLCHKIYELIDEHWYKRDSDFRSDCKYCHHARYKNYYEKNKEHVLTSMKVWARRNPEKTTLNARRYRKNNPDARRSSNRKWRNNNPEKAKRAVQRRRNRKLSARGNHSHAEIAELYDWQHGKCFYCGSDLSEGFTEDHYIALTKGGDDTIHNIYLSCKSCNSKKHNKLPWIFDSRCL